MLLSAESPREVHLQALTECFPRLSRDMMARETTLLDQLVADDVISVARAESICKKDTGREVNEEILKVVQGLSQQRFQETFLPALERDPGNAILARELTSAMRRLQEDARSQSQGGCRICGLRDRVEPRRLADELLARGVIPRGLYDDLRKRSLCTDEAWNKLFRCVGHTQKLIPILSLKYPAVVEEMEKYGIASLECQCHRGLQEVVEAQSEGVASDIARMSDFTSQLQKETLPLPGRNPHSK